MKNLLTDLFIKYDIDYNEKQIEKLCLFYQNVIEKNKVLNLTAIVEKQDFAIKNILDSILPAKLIPHGASVVDVGVGAGFPSIPLKIMREDLSVTMVDSLNKRILFLQEQIEVLGLKNIVAIHSRAEDFAKTNREKFDISVARAVSHLSTLCEYLLPLTKVGGKMISYKGQRAQEEINESQNAINILGGKITDKQVLEIVEIDSQRVNIEISKIKQTPSKYPRGKNLPKTSKL